MYYSATMSVSALTTALTLVCLFFFNKRSYKDYCKLIVRSTYDSDLQRAKTSLGNIRS